MAPLSDSLLVKPQTDNPSPGNLAGKVNLSWVHMHNLHPGANLHSGCIFGHVSCVLRIYTFALTFEVEQTYLQIEHINAFFLISIHFDREF